MAETTEKVFLSYRRDDTTDITSHIANRLETHFGRQIAFRDADDVSPGSDFRERIRNALNECAVMLVIIGQRWLSIVGDNGRRRLDDPDDYVRFEIETALVRNIVIIPVLVHGAQMPDAEDLPESIRELRYRQAEEVRSSRGFPGDIGRLIQSLVNAGLAQPNLPPPFEYVLIPLGGIFTFFGISAFVAIFDLYWGRTLRIESEAFFTFAMGIGLGAFCFSVGPALACLGKWWCCGRQNVRRKLFFPGAVTIQPKPKAGGAVIALGMGLSALGLNLLTAIPAWIIGMRALRTIKASKGQLGGESLAWQGMAYALIGTLASTLFIWLAICAYHPYQILASAKLLLSKKENEKAALLMDELVALRPGNAIFLKNRGIVSLTMGQNDRAVGDFSSAIKFFPPGASYAPDQAKLISELFVFRSEARRRNGDLGGASDDLQIAREFDPSATALRQDLP